MRNITVFLFVFVALSFSQANAQKEANIWYFGNFAGMDFNSGAPVALLNGQINTFEGVASIATANGRLMFYTDGQDVWDSTHAIMQNGTGLLGDNSSSQSGIIVPYPGNINRYFIFTVDGGGGQDGLNYSVVDMTLNGGFGAVVPGIKNIQLLTPTTEKVTAITQANGFDFWVVTHGLNTDEFYAYPVTSAGVGVPVISNTGSVHSGSYPYIGCMKASHDATKLAAAVCYMGFIDVCSFDNTSGVVNFLYSLAGNEDPYGVEFSPDDTKLYAASRAPWAMEAIYQFDLTLGTGVAVASSKSYVYQTTNTAAYGSLQLAPDGKIYVANTSGNYLGTIDFPNQPAALCGYTFNGFYLGGASSQQGLPNFVQSFFIPPTFTWVNECLGDSTIFTISDTFNVDSVLWSFNDTTSGLFNTSTALVDAFHIFSDTGHFQVSLILFHSGGLIDTISETVSIYPILQPFDLGNDTSICNYDSLLLDAFQPGADYLWNNGSTLSSFLVVVTDTYFVNISNPCISWADTIIVTVNTAPVAELGNDTTLCLGDSIVFNTGQHPAANYLWHNGSIDSVFVAQTTGQYWVEVSNMCGVVSDTINLTFVTAGSINLGNDSTLCDTSGHLLVTNVAGSTLLWNDGSTADSLLAMSTGLYWVEASTACGTVGDSIYLNFENTPFVDLGSDTTTCFGDTLVLNAAFDDVNYLWNDGSVDSQMIVTQAGAYWVELSNSCGTTFDTILVTSPVTFSVDLGNDTIVCPGTSLVFDASAAGVNYLWYDGSTDSTHTTTDSGVIWVALSDLCTVTSDTMLISHFLLDNPELGNDTVLCAGNSLTLDATTPGATSYLWFDNSTNSVATMFTAGTYWVEVANACETKSDTMTITVPSLLNVDIGPDLVICPDVSVQIGDTSSGPTILWNTGETTSTISVSNSGIYWLEMTGICETVRDSLELTVSQPSFDLGNDTTICEETSLELTVPGFQWYIWQDGSNSENFTINQTGLISLTVMDAFGCAFTDSILVTNQVCLFTGLAVPTAFSPNADGHNDFFGAIAKGVTILETHVFNRWGEKVFYSDNYSSRWDGTYKHENCPVGTYTWMVRYLDENEKDVLESGNVTLVR